MRWPYAWIAWETICHWKVLVAWSDVAGRGSCKKEGLAVQCQVHQVSMGLSKACLLILLVPCGPHPWDLWSTKWSTTSLLVTRRKRLLKGSRRREFLWIWLENQLLRFSPSCREFLPWFAELFGWFSLWFSSLLTKQEEEAAARRKQVLWIAHETTVFFKHSVICCDNGTQS